MGELYKDDADRQVVITGLMAAVIDDICSGSSALSDQTISRKLGDIIRDFYLSSDQIITMLQPLSAQPNQISRAVKIINSALILAGMSDRVTARDFLPQR